MKNALRAHRRRLAERDDKGFTLIELMVVVLIIAVLLLIAIPQFLGARQGAQNKGAQASLRTALTAAKSYVQDNGSYADISLTDLSNREKNLTFVESSGSVTKANEVLFVKVDDRSITLIAHADFDRCFAVTDNVNDASTFGATDSATKLTSCDAASVPIARFNPDQKVGWK